MNRIIIHGLKPKFRSFVATIQGQATQPFLVEFENLLAGQEALTKQTVSVTIKEDGEALYAEKNKGKHRSLGYHWCRHYSDRNKNQEKEKDLQA